MAARNRCRECLEDKQKAKENKRERELLDIASGGLGDKPKRQNKQQTQNSGKLGFRPADNKQAEADCALARAFYSTGVAPNVLDNIEMQIALRKVALVGSSYVPVGRRMVDGNLLTDEKARLRKQCEARRAVVASRTGTTAVSDGATNVNHAPVLNLLEVCAGCAEYIDSKDCSGNVKDAAYIANYIIDWVTTLEVCNCHNMCTTARRVVCDAPVIVGPVLCVPSADGQCNSVVLAADRGGLPVDCSRALHDALFGFGVGRHWEI